MITDPLLEQDCQRLLKRLQEAPCTHSELTIALRLSSARISFLLETLQQRGYVRASHDASGKRDRNALLWERTNATQD
jgi:predicted ArsR family transcriptional regulator